ncbi:MAG: nitrous oxide reductase family maturation protein NosD [Chitinophagaceae bacterium]|nr:MAG: nitrous oxide reductase family maturation protein NosD [Chitinophagaceae bacterium]
MRLLLILLIAFPLGAGARTLDVGRGAYPSIRQAIAAASPGDTVRVGPGTYTEGTLNIDKPLTLLGTGSPRLDGQYRDELIIITGADVQVSGFVFLHSGSSSSRDLASVSIANTHNIRINDNRFEEALFGIHAANSSSLLFQNNYLKGRTRTEQTSGNGIHLWKCSGAVVEHNEIHGHRDGIYLEFVSHSLIRSNTSSDNIRYGIHFMFSDRDLYVGNTFSRNGAGVAVMFSNKVVISRNRFLDNWGASAYGLLLKEISDVLLWDNDFYHNTSALQMEGTNRVVARRNSFRANGWAARVQASCSDNVFEENNFIGNTFDVATNGSLVLNRFDRNYWDKYEGYDRNRDGAGDIPYHPVSLYSMIVEKNPTTLILLRSFMVNLLDKVEKAIPSLTPENLVDEKPLMKPLEL